MKEPDIDKLVARVVSSDPEVKRVHIVIQNPTSDRFKEKLKTKVESELKHEVTISGAIDNGYETITIHKKK